MRSLLKIRFPYWAQPNYFYSSQAKTVIGMSNLKKNTISSEYLHSKTLNRNRNEL